MINGKQNVKLKSGSISFKNYFKQCLLKGVKSSDEKNSSYTEKYQDHIPCSFAYKVVCADNKLNKTLFFTEEKMLLTDLLKQFLKSMIIVKKKKKDKKHFNKNLIISAEEEKSQLSNSCWICNKLSDVGDEKVRDHCHMTRKYRGAAHWSCNINLKMTKKIPDVFHNLRGYDSHLIIKEISKFDVKVSVIPNGLEKYMT